MSPTELLALSRGRIPAQIVLSEIQSYVESWGGEPGDWTPLKVLAEKTGLSDETLATWLYKESVQSIAFDDADRLFAAMGKVSLWRGEYADYYEGCDLSWTRCACPGCEVMFKASHVTTGPTVKLYCSKACRTSAAKQREGVTSRRSKRYLDVSVCRNNHPKTPENTKTRRDGRTECIICARAAAKRCYDKRMGRAA